MVLVPKWAQWINEGNGYPPCCFTCCHYKHGVCILFDMEPPEDFAGDLNVCDKYEFDNIPF